MAEGDKNPEIEKRKDKAFERILAEALSSGARDADCPDAETLAAFYERALAPAETAHWRAHFAGCSRCQQTLASMAASDPNPLAAEEVARLGELVAAASAPRAAAPRSRRLNWTRFLDPRTLAPLAAAAVFAVALWMSVHAPFVAPPGMEFASEPSAPEPLVAENQPAPPSPTAPARRLAEGSAPQAEMHHASNAATPNSAAPPMPAEVAGAAAPTAPIGVPGAVTESVSPTAAAPITQSQQDDEISQSKTASEGAAGSPDSASAPSAAEGEAGGTSGGAAANPALEIPRSANESVVVRARGAMLAPAPLAKIVRAQAVSSNGPTAADKTKSQVAWQFGAGGRIARSTDGGATWTPQSSPVQSELLAGSAPTETVCWLVGRNGAIVRTVDGATWRQVPSPPQAEQNGRPPDWTFVEARDALSAVIATQDGLRYATDDGGATWQPQ
jgi:photosynthesis system II assembly factor YCF48-like protein